MNKIERIQDPIHGLIKFSSHIPSDYLAWQLIATPEFQRLRRIRQMGLSETVFPGAVHSRFAHSLGVYHMARLMMQKMAQLLGSFFDEDRALTALLAALLHDVGHGPFSHAFETAFDAEESQAIHHEEWSANIITGDTNIAAILEKHQAGLAKKIAAMLLASHPEDIYGAVVSSQFDADRLDYLQRDRYMTGIGAGAFDLPWLLDCLEVGNVANKAPSFYINHKGMQAAESYILARCHLFQKVYLHKTARGAEILLSILLKQLQRSLIDHSLPSFLHDIISQLPLGRYMLMPTPDVANYLALDDYSIWGILPILEQHAPPLLANMAARLLRRHFLKCFDSGLLTAETADSLKEILSQHGLFQHHLTPILWGDDIGFSAYGLYAASQATNWHKIWVETGDAHWKDLAEISPVIAAVGDSRFIRVYGEDGQHIENIRKICRQHAMGMNLPLFENFS
ncbi:MAG: HD domain-containing protein [Alphaproteobacteria bacterium]